MKNNQVVTTDAEIAKNNRLSLMMDIHKRRQQENTTNHVEKQETEEKMGKETGTCEQCGKREARLTKHYGKECCASCSVMRGFVRTKPDFVVAALREFHGEQYVQPAPGTNHDIEGMAEELKLTEQARKTATDNCNLFYDRIYGLLENCEVEGWTPATSADELCEILKKYVYALREGVMRLDSTILTNGVDKAEYIAALTMAYDIEHARCLELDSDMVIDRDTFHRELVETIMQIMAVTNPGVALDDPSLDDCLAVLPGQIRQMYVDQERLAEKAAVLSKIRECISLDPAVPDDRIVSTLHNLLLPSSSNPDQSFVGEIAAHLGMVELPTPEQVIKAVAELSMALAHAQQNCHDLTKANNQQREQINQLARNMTACSIVEQIEDADVNKDGPLLDLALATLRGDNQVVADKLELMR